MVICKMWMGGQAQRNHTLNKVNGHKQWSELMC